MPVYRRPVVTDPRFSLVSDGFEFDMPGPYTISWRLSHARDRLQRARGIEREEVIPVTTGVLFAAAPYVVGAATVAFAPPWMKPLGVSMMVPTGVGEAFWFGVGYGFGKQFQDQIPDWVL